jgi:hypothetical protein
VPRVRVLVRQHSNVVSPQLNVSPFVEGFPSFIDGFRVDSVVHLRAHSSAPARIFYPVQAQFHEFVFDVSSEAGLQPFLQLPMCREVDHIKPLWAKKGLVFF